MMEKKRIGIVADDITGSNDVGVMLAKNGFATAVISLEDAPCPQDFDGLDALVINTASRLDNAEVARAKTLQAAQFLKSMHCDMIHTKTCSVFRGNIGASFDTVQDATGVSCSMVVAGFPRNGRTTLHGVHYVNGTPVGESAFANDPVTPLRFSRLDELIGQQSARPCRVFDCAWLDQPPAQQQAHLTALKAEAAYVLFDVRCQDDLYTVARLIANEPNICGASAICEALPMAWGQASPAPACPAVQDDPCGVLVLAGSLTPQTTAQLHHLMAGGMPSIVLDPAALVDDTAREEEIRRAADTACTLIASGRDAVVYAARETAGVRALSQRLGLTDIEAGRRISLGFEGLARAVHQVTHATRYLVAGGETSDAVSRGLGVRTMRIWQEIEAGVPMMTATTHTGENLRLVLKSGSFGSEAFLHKAAACLHQ